MPEEEHLVPRLAREAKEITRDVGEFFSPVEKHFGPHEDEDWPRDLTVGELAGLMPQLRETIQNLSYAITLILEEESLGANRADPGKAELVAGGVRLVEQGAKAIRAGEALFGTAGTLPGARTQQELAAENFPRGPAASPRPGSGTADTPGRGPDSATRASTPLRHRT